MSGLFEFAVLVRSRGFLAMAGLLVAPMASVAAPSASVTALGASVVVAPTATTVAQAAAGETAPIT